MSLINQVLKDLEKRHANVDAGALGRAVRPLPDERSRRTLCIGLTIMVIAAVTVSGAWWWTKRADAFALFASNKPAAQQVAASAPTNPQPAKSDAVSSAVGPTAVEPAPVRGLPAAAAASGSQTSHLTTSSEQAVPTSPSAAKPNASVAAATTHANPASAPVDPDRNTKSAPLSPSSAQAASPPAVASSAPAKKAVAAPTAVQPPRMVTTGSSAAPVPVRPNPVRAKPRVLPEPEPNTSVQVAATEYPDVKQAPGDANIEKQVRAPTVRDRAEASFRQGMGFLQNGSMAEAEAAFREALHVDPLLDKARQALLGIYVEAGRREDAERLLEDRLQVDRKNFGFAMALARLQLGRGSNGDALITLQRSLPYGENSADYQAMLANALSRVSRHKEAAERYDVASRLAPRNALWLMGLGVELRADTRNAEARAAFQRAREIGGLNAQLTAFLDQQLRELQ
jgi:MSHA biogenesis protein MshN